MMYTILDNSSKYNMVPEFLTDAISNLLFKNELIVYNFENHYSPVRAMRKAHIISDKSPDGSITMKRYIVNYVKQGGMIEIFRITEDKNTL